MKVMKANRLGLAGVLSIVFLASVLFVVLAGSALLVDRNLMAQRIESAGNSDDVHLCFRHLAKGAPNPKSYDDVPLRVLLPAFVLSELKSTFLVGKARLAAPRK